MSVPTPGAANAYPRVGPVVINEIMYHPAFNADAEYVETPEHQRRARYAVRRHPERGVAADR